MPGGAVKMARLWLNLCLVLVLLKITMPEHAAGRAALGEKEEMQEAERSCHGAFDLYFVLDK